MDNAGSSNGGSQIFQEIKDKKGMTKRQKIFIALGVFLAISMIIGGVVAYKIISEQSGP